MQALVPVVGAGKSAHLNAVHTHALCLISATLNKAMAWKRTRCCARKDKVVWYSRHLKTHQLGIDGILITDASFFYSCRTRTDAEAKTELSPEEKITLLPCSERKYKGLKT